MVHWTTFLQQFVITWKISTFFYTMSEGSDIARQLGNVTHVSCLLFSADFPEWFGDIGKSLYSLFQVMTLESWSMGIVRPVMEIFPYAWAFFVIFIIVSSFTVLNLFIAIIVDSMQTLHDDEDRNKDLSTNVETDGDVKFLYEEIKELRSEINRLSIKLSDKN